MRKKHVNNWTFESVIYCTELLTGNISHPGEFYAATVLVILATGRDLRSSDYDCITQGQGAAV
jgi:hypothetical protein